MPPCLTSRKHEAALEKTTSLPETATTNDQIAIISSQPATPWLQFHFIYCNLTLSSWDSTLQLEFANSFAARDAAAMPPCPTSRTHQAALETKTTSSFEIATANNQIATISTQPATPWL